MATSLNLDPFEVWRQAVTRLEDGMNTLGAQSLQSAEVRQGLLQMSGLSMQMQHVMDKALGKYFKTINLPSRQEVMQLAEALRRIEDKLDQLLPAPPQPLVARPARTRRPDTAAAPVPAVPVPAPKPRRAVGGRRARRDA